MIKTMPPGAYLEHDPKYLVDSAGSIGGLLVMELDITETLLTAGVLPPVLGGGGGEGGQWEVVAELSPD